MWTPHTYNLHDMSFSDYDSPFPLLEAQEGTIRGIARGKNSLHLHPHFP